MLDGSFHIRLWRRSLRRKPPGGTFFSDTLSLLAASYLFEEVFSADLAALEDELHAIQVGGVGMRAA